MKVKTGKTMKKILFEEIIDGMVINRTIRDHEYTMPSKHFHNEYEIYYLLEGERYYFIEDQTYLVNKGYLVFINHNQIHKTGLAGDPHHDRIVLELNGEFLAPFFSSIGEFSIEAFFSKHFGILKLSEEGQLYVENLLFDMVKEIQNKAPNYKSMVYMKLAELLIYSLRLKEKESLSFKGETSQTPKHQKVHEITIYIAQNYTKINSLDDLAKLFYINKCYLSRIFKEVTGFTVNEYINIHKIKHAQEFLINSDYNITEIAVLLGYDNITYFERAFKKYTETTPLKYRKKMLHYTKQIRDQKAE